MVPGCGQVIENWFGRAGSHTKDTVQDLVQAKIQHVAHLNRRLVIGFSRHIPVLLAIGSLIAAQPASVSCSIKTALVVGLSVLFVLCGKIIGARE